jgi:hypothetical protein
MSTHIEELLTRLEEVNTRAVDSSDPALHQAVNTFQVLEIIEERGRLIEELQPVLAAHAPVSYVEWNRLVVVHHQGSLLLENLRQVRSRLALELGANNNSRLFLERVTGMLAPVQD